MKTCTKCLISYPDDKKFCKKCGAILIPENNIIEQEGNIKVNSFIKESGLILEVKTSKHQSPQKGNKSTLKKIIIIGTSFIAVFIVIIILIFYFKQKNAWNEAEEINSINSFQSYINDYPTGRYVDEAKLKIKLINETVIMQRQQAIQDSVAHVQKAIADSIAAVGKQSNITINQKPSTLTIKGTKVNIRSFPSLRSNVLFQLNTGDVCYIAEKGNLENINGATDYWFKVNFNGKIGWVFGTFSSLSTINTSSNSSTCNGNKTGKAIYDRVYFYSSPNLNSRLNTYIVRDQNVEIISNDGDFWGVSFTFNNKTTKGFIRKMDLSL